MCAQSVWTNPQQSKELLRVVTGTAILAWKCRLVVNLTLDDVKMDLDQHGCTAREDFVLQFHTGHVLMLLDFRSTESQVPEILKRENEIKKL